MGVWCQGDSGPQNVFGKCFISLQSLEQFEKDWCKFFVYLVRFAKSSGPVLYLHT